jgi:thioester reductase-like protein
VTDPKKRDRAKIIEGDITLPNLGLSQAVLQDLRDRVTHAIHLAALYNLSVPRDVAMLVNVDGTRHILDFLETVKSLKLFGHMSTIAVSGTHVGPFTEDDFDIGQSFKNYYEETKYLAEKLVRERSDKLPTVIFRPSVVVGHSITGAIEKVDGPYYALTMIARYMHLVSPDCGTTKCHMAPVDFVADAFYSLIEDERSEGLVYHLADPNPLTFNEFFDLACASFGRVKPIVRLPARWMIPLARMSLFQKLSGVPYDAFLYSNQPLGFPTDKTTAALVRYGITCPPVSSYIDVMVSYFREHYRDPNIRRGDWRQGTT